MIKNKLAQIKKKIIRDKKKVYAIILIMLVFLFTLIAHNINNNFSKLFANIKNISNADFKDEYFYSCVINAYNKENNTSKTKEDNLTDDELASITNIESCGYAYDVSGIEKLTGLISLIIYHSESTEIDLSKNSLLETFTLSDNPNITSLDLSGNLSLTSLNLRNCGMLSKLILNENVNLKQINLDGTALLDSVSLKIGDTYKLKSNIIGPKLTYHVSSNTIIGLEGDTITALKEGYDDIDIYLNGINIGRQRIYVGKMVELTTYYPEHITINNSEKYVYVKDGTKYLKYDLNLDQHSSSDIHSSIGHPEISDMGDTLKIMSYDDIIDEYKLVYVDTGIKNEDNAIIISSVDEPNKLSIKGVNCDYEFSNDKKELIIKYNGDEIDRKNVIKLFVPFSYKVNKNYADEIFIFDKNMPQIKRISNVDEIDENMINILDYNMTLDNEYDDTIKITDDSNNELSEIYYYSVYSENYDLSKDYIYLGTKEFNNDINCSGDFEFKVSNDSIVSYEEGKKVLEWYLIKVSSDIYDMSGDVIDLKGTELDISKINVTNANLKVDNNKLLVMYNDEVVKEFELENGKKEDTTTKPSEEKITSIAKGTTDSTKEDNKVVTSNKVTKTTKRADNRVTSTTKNNTITKEESKTNSEITTKNISIRKKYSKTTKLNENNSNVKNENKNSIRKIISDNSFLILVSIGVFIIGILLYIYINKKDK